MVARSVEKRKPGGLPFRSVSTELLAMEDVSLIRSGRYLLRGVNWEVHRGERWVLLGPNGAGKTTLLQLAAAYLAPTRGTVRVLGKPLGRVDSRELRRRIGYAGPSPAALLRSELAVRELVVTGKHASFVASRWHRFEEEDWRRAEELLDRMGAGGLAGRPYRTLSEGERQRVLIARSLMPEPDLLLLDEPAAELDLGARERLVQALEALAADRRAPGMILVTHHVEDIPPSFDRLLLLAEGRVVGRGQLDANLEGALLSRCFGVPLRVERRNGRYRAWADG